MFGYATNETPELPPDPLCRGNGISPAFEKPPFPDVPGRCQGAGQL
ncbi:MAG: hypothetical protein ACLRT5_22960 [Lachnospiraceae bacterium]